MKLISWGCVHGDEISPISQRESRAKQKWEEHWGNNFQRKESQWQGSLWLISYPGCAGVGSVAGSVCHLGAAWAHVLGDQVFPVPALLCFIGHPSPGVTVRPRSPFPLERNSHCSEWGKREAQKTRQVSGVKILAKAQQKLQCINSWDFTIIYLFGLFCYF